MTISTNRAPDRRTGMTVATLAVLGGAAQAASSKPAGMSGQAYRALMLRSQALNERYGLGELSRVPAGMTAAEYRSVQLRSEALNKRYHLGRWSLPTAARTPVRSSERICGRNVGLGAVAMLGLVLVAAGVVARNRYTRDATRVTTS